MGFPARWDGKLHAAQRSKQLMNCSPKSAVQGGNIRGGERVVERFVKNQAHLSFHRAAIEGGADLQPALDGFVELADDDGGHEAMVAHRC